MLRRKTYEALVAAWNLLVELTIGALTLIPILFVAALIFCDVKEHL